MNHTVQLNTTVPDQTGVTKRGGQDSLGYQRAVHAGVHGAPTLPTQSTRLYCLLSRSQALHTGRRRVYFAGLSDFAETSGFSGEMSMSNKVGLCGAGSASLPVRVSLCLMLWPGLPAALEA